MYRYYRVLKIKPGADLSEIKKAFRQSVQKYHPDANGGVGDTDKFKEVVKAYHYLQNHYKVLGIKPVRSRQSVLSEFWKGFIETMSKKRYLPGFPVYAKTAEPPPRKRKIQNNFRIDERVLELSYAELTFRLTESESDFVKKQATRALATLFGAGVLPLLKRTLKEASTQLSEEIIHCLGIIGNRDAVMELEKQMRHTDIKIACAAVRALQSINRGQARVLLERMAREGRAFWLAVTQLADTYKLRRFLRHGLIEKSDVDIARVLRRNTHQPLPMVLQELGWVIPL